jgi:hypothetical protein
MMMKKKLQIAVLFGGRSGEHEVSLMSARSVLSVLDPAKYEVKQIGIAPTGQWFTGEDVLGKFESGKLSGLETAVVLPDPPSPASGTGTRPSRSCRISTCSFRCFTALLEKTGPSRPLNGRRRLCGGGRAWIVRGQGPVKDVMVLRHSGG